MLTIPELEEEIRESKFFEELEPGNFIIKTRNEDEEEKDLLKGIDLLLDDSFYRLDKIPQYVGYVTYIKAKPDSKVLIQWE